MSNASCPVPVIYDYLESYVSYRKLVKLGKEAELKNISDSIELVIPVFGARKGKKQFYDGAKNFKKEDEVNWNDEVGWFNADTNLPILETDKNTYINNISNDGVYKRFGKIYKLFAWRKLAEYWTVVDNEIVRLEIKLEAAPSQEDIEKARKLVSTNKTNKELLVKASTEELGDYCDNSIALPPSTFISQFELMESSFNVNNFASPVNDKDIFMSPKIIAKSCPEDDNGSDTDDGCCSVVESDFSDGRKINTFWWAW